MTEYFYIGERIPPKEICGCNFPHDYNLRIVIFGNVLSVLDLLPNFGMMPPYGVFYDEITYNIIGKKILENLNGKGFIVKYPTFSEAEIHLRKAKTLKTAIAVGGGTVIDVTRYVAYHAKVNFIAIPTAPSQDGIASPRAALYSISPSGEMVYKGTADAKAPDIVIFDLSIVSSAPSQLIKSGYGDILTKLTSIKDWQLARDDVGEPYCKTAEKLALKAVDNIITIGRNYSSTDSIKRLCEALILSGASMGVVNSTRPAGGSEHMVGRHLELFTKRKLPHGIAASIGTLLMAVYHEMKNPNWWIEEKYRFNSIKKYCEQWNIPTRFDEINIPKKVMIDAIISSWKTRPERYTILHKYQPTYQEAEEILNIAGIL